MCIRDRNEVQEFLDCHYVGAPEATRRLLGFHVHGRSHQVDRLPVHLPLEQSIQFEAGAEGSA
eukprot:6305701-Pyramimonas_sp.AAC.1